MIKLIGISGYAGAGKSTAAKRLVTAHGFILVKMAGPLKNMMRALGLGERELEGDLKEQPCALLCGRTPRHAMQALGTEWGRESIGADFWIRAAMESVHAVLNEGGRVVIDDIRFPDEVAAVRAIGGITVKITRPGVGPVNEHSSEHHELAIDYDVINDGAITDLNDRLDHILQVVAASSEITSGAPDQISEAIAAYWGMRCPDHEPDCHCCRAWTEYDKLKKRASEADGAGKLRSAVELGIQMRRAQIAYFKDRSADKLIVAKSAESEFDKLARESLTDGAVKGDRA